MFPGAHHLPGHGIQVVPLVLGPVVEAVAGLERGTLVAVAANLLLITFSRLIPKNIYFYFVLLEYAVTLSHCQDTGTYFKNKPIKY